MTFKEKIKSSLFWISLLKVVAIFCVVMTIVSLVFNSFSDIFSGNWSNIYNTNFANGKWKLFFGYKLIFSFLYGLWTVNNKLK